MAKTGAIEKLKAMAKDRVDAKALKDFVAAGKDVPLSYKGREHVWDRKVKKYAAGGEAKMQAGGDPSKPYIGYRRAGRRPESQQDRAASANIPVAVARGLVSGTLGMPGDLESLARLPYELITGKESPTILPTSGDIEKRLPFRGASQTPVGQMFTGASQLAGGAYTGPLSGARAAMAVPKAVMQAGRDFVGAAGQSVSPLTVYQGSPHKFAPTPKNPLGEFDASKIGTGEGAQAYGHGHYLAESPVVAKGYQEKLSKNVTVDGSKLQSIPSDSPLAEAHNMVVRNIQNGMKPEEAISATQKYWTDAANEMQSFAKSHPELADRIQKEASGRMQVSDAAKTLKPESFHLDPGHLYTVDLPDEKIARMLDWDKPLSEQPEVIKALKGTDYEVGMSQKQAEKIADQRLREEADEWAEMTGGDPVDYSNNVDWESYVDRVRKESGSIDSSITGKDLHRMIMRDEGYRPDLFDTENYQVGTSEALRGYGIPGVKYLDRQSRQAGEGSRNFVVFPGEEDALTILERKKAGGEVKMAAGGISRLLGKGAKTAKVDHPLVFPRAEPKTREEIRPIAQRVAEQMTGEFVRQNPKVTTNPVGKSRKQFERERNIPLETRNVVPEKNVPPVDYEKLKDYAIVGVPGDPSMGGVARAGSFDDPARATVELTRVGDITPDSPVPLFGGPRYGDDEKFWASNLGAATPIQSNVNALGELYDAPVLGKYIKMAPDSANFAMHNLDSLLAIQRPEQLSKGKLEQLNRLIRNGSPKYGKFPGFSGFDDPVDVLLQSQLNSDLRKHIAETLTKPTITQALGLPNGQDVVAAITHPELRNLETGVSGFSIGRMVPGATLKKGESAHPTYDTDIPGQLIGRSKYPTPYEIAFPDTTAYARSQIKPGVQEFNMMKLLGPRERIDQQYVDEMKTFEELMKQYTGKKKGGAVKSGLSSIKKV